MSANAIAAGVAAGSLSAEDVIAETLARIDKAQGLNAFCHVAAERALAEARALDARRARGETLGPLAGVPLAVKDNICTKGLPTGCSSAILDGWIPPYDATAVARLTAAGAIVVGKTGCDEFGMGSSNEHSIHGPVRNPHDTSRVPGGSSGGSAAAVAAGLVPLALGSDTGGSVRQPAALSGILGLKPSWGRVSRYGLVAFASSFDQIGPLARSSADLALALAAMAGQDPRDATSADAPVPALEAALDAGVSTLRIGLAESWLAEAALDSRVVAGCRAAADAFAALGARVDAVRLPDAERTLRAYRLIASAEASSNLARFDGVRYGRAAEEAETLAEHYEKTRGQGFGPEVQRRILLGTLALAANTREDLYGRALAERARLCAELDDRFEEHDLLLLPCTPEPAFPLGSRTEDPLAMYRSDLHTVLASLTGHPALALPAPRAAGQLPVGVQLVARPFAEDTLLAAAAALEARGFCAEAA